MILANGYFSGAGLMEIGLERAGITIQQSFEIDPKCCATQRANFNHQVIESDITKKLVKDDLQCHLMAITYPCTKYSKIGDIHGVRTGDELYLHALRHIVIGRPEIYAVENVPGMKKFAVVMEAMTKLPDYYVSVFCPIKSSTWLPQKRDRMIILGSRKPFSWRLPECQRRMSLADILEDNPSVEVPSYVAKRMAGAYRDRPIISDPSRGDLAPTCVAHYAKDLSTRLIVDARFPGGVRPYSVREYARLQGVPDDFKFVGTDRDAYRMIGNGVSVQVGEWIGAEVRRYFSR